MSDETVIKRKLIFDGDGMGEDKKILAFVKLLPRWILSDDTSNDSEETYNKLLAQLESVITIRKKSELIKRANAKQTETFKMLQATYEGNINVIKEDIEEQKNLLRRAKIVKQNYVEYDLLVKTITQEPSRQELNQKIENLTKEIKKLEKEKETLDQKLNSRVKQCYVLSTSANTLKGILQEDPMDNSSNSENSELDLQVTLS